MGKKSKEPGEGERTMGTLQDTVIAEKARTVSQEDRADELAKLDQEMREIDAQIEQFIDAPKRIREIKTKKAYKPLNAVNGLDLQRMELPKIQFVVDKILPKGLVILGAPSKYYKSWLAMDLCLCVARGKDFLGFKTNKCDCLYMDLESRLQRSQSRMKMILGEEDAPSNFQVVTDCQQLGAGLEEQLIDYITKNPGTGLIVIDVFQKIRRATGSNQSLYEKDYSDLTAIKDIADNFGICILLVHHTRKMKDDSDVFNDLSGSSGIMGTSDAAWVISKEKRDSVDAKLCITGRDVEQEDYVMQFDKATKRWKEQGIAEEIREQSERTAYDSNPVVYTIKKLLGQCTAGEEVWTGTMTDLINASQYFHNGIIYDNPIRTSNIIAEMESRLYRYDGILHDVKKKR